MPRRKKGDFLKTINPFSFGLPSAPYFFLILLIISVIMGTAATALLNHNSINSSLYYIIANGSFTGILFIMLPAMLTMAVVKLFKRYIELKYLGFVAVIGALSYSVFLLLSAIVYIVSKNYALAELIIILGDASLFGWWFFAIKIMTEKGKKNLIFPLIHPTLNIILYAPYSAKIISFSTPFNVLLVKLYAGIFIFLLVGYTIIYLVDRPYKKNFGFYSFDAFTQLMQNWLFDINTSAPFGAKFGTHADIMTDTVTVKEKNGKMKALFFAPEIHYGPAGTIGGSDFPHMLERHVLQKYKVPAFIMHRTVDMDNNPVSSTQFNQIRDALEKGVKEATYVGSGITYTENSNGDSKVSRLGVGKISFVTLTRAPRITEDVSHGAALLFREVLETRFGTSIVIDAHNSRFESAPKEELDGVKVGSEAYQEYIAAIKGMGLPKRRGKELRAGFSTAELYHALGSPLDIARGNMNVGIFGYNGFKYAIIHINANNMLPQLRKRILAHLQKKYKLSAEVYTTDTHAVNSLGFEADNVVGRHTKFERLESMVDRGVEAAIEDMERVTVCHSRGSVKRFKIWGQNSMTQIIAIGRSVYDFTRIMIPVIVVVGFIAAAFVISVI